MNQINLNQKVTLRKTVLTIFFLISPLIFHGTSQAQLMIIAHPEISIHEISQSRLKQIYLNRSKKWQDGSRIHLTILENCSTSAQFIDKYLGKSSAQFNRYWKRQLFSGKGIPPVYFKTVAELLAYIQSTKGAIGFIDSSTAPDGVAVIKLVQ